MRLSLLDLYPVPKGCRMNAPTLSVALKPDRYRCQEELEKDSWHLLFIKSRWIQILLVVNLVFRLSAGARVLLSISIFLVLFR